ncbi:TonB-dependent receptor [Aliidiomarina halalkaliphila]|uniref:TonB-dependent receptor n=1 Tax=Aliidiomarina halalkaliphila TaxID=2593535 RepID=A0A552X0T8_9GAMM|nr:TonB-dependent receptor [Aliidiomarina halalkaliphila]TRW48668.1 TonB-dependent receptor [Aliidiomarina halalkaliphila]
MANVVPFSDDGFQLNTIRLAVLASLFLSSVQAQTVDTTETEDTAAINDYVVVTATRTERPWIATPASVERVDVSQQLPGQRTDAAELLQGLAGVQTDTRYNFAQDTRVVLRGFGTRAAFGVRGVRMRLDGIPLSMPDGQAQTSSILLDEPARVEVLRGPFAAIYGNSAGGVIDLQSERPLRSELTADLSAGSANRERQRLRGVYAQEQHSFSLDYARFRTDGDRPRSQVERDQWAARWYMDVTDSMELILRWDDNDAPLLQDPLALTPEQWREDPSQTASQATTFDTRKTIRHRQQSITLRDQLDATEWRVAAWTGQRDIEQYLAFPGAAITASGGVVDLERSFAGVNATYSWLPLHEHDWRVTLGVDFERQTDERKGYVNQMGTRGDLRRDETGRVRSQDVALISDYAINPRMTWLFGLRYSDLDFQVDDRFIVPGNPDDSGETSYQEWSWSSGVNYQINPNLSGFIATGRGFETPTLTEMAYQNEGTGLNTDLRAAKLEQHELGLKWFRGNWRGQASAFTIDTRDDLVVDQSIDGRTTYRNAARTERQGIELSTYWAANDYWLIRTAYTWLDARYRGDENDGNRLPGLARSNLYSQLEWRPWGDQRIRISLENQYRSRVPTTDSNNEYAPAASVWNAAIQSSYGIANWSLKPWLRINNLGDKTYVGSVVVNQGNGRSFEPAPGRIWLAGFTLSRAF